MLRLHGGCGASPGVLDFSETGNPLPPPRLLEVVLRKLVRKRIFTVRPDYGYESYRKAVSGLLSGYAIEPEEIVPVAGVSDALRLALLVFRPRVVVALEPVSGKHRELARVTGARYVPVTYRFEERACSFDPTKLDAVVASYGDETGLVFMSNPSNPAGCVFVPTTIRLIVDSIPRGWLMFIDESFGDFLEHGYSALSLVDERVVVARSFSKTLSMRGLRAGYVYAPGDEVRRSLNAARDPWPISTLASKVIEALLNEEGPEGYRAYVNKSKYTTEKEYRYLARNLERASLTIYPSAAPHFLAEHPWSRHPKVNEVLSRVGVRVRDASTFYGLSDRFSRISIKRRRENRILVKAIEFLASVHGVKVDTL